MDQPVESIFTMTSATEWRTRVGAVWAQEWRHNEASFADLAPHLDAAIRAAAPTGTIAAFDIGCGAGATAAALARARPDAAVIGADVSEDLITVARARHSDLPNLAFRHADALDAAEDVAPLDLIFSRHGVMFFADPVAAFARLRCAARPGAALVFSCFRDRADNVWAGDLVREVTGITPSAVSGFAPGPFGFADPHVTSDILAAAGWTIVGRDRLDFAYVAGEGNDPIDAAVRFFRRIGPLASAIGAAPDPAAVIVRLKVALERYRTDHRVALPASAWLWQARA